MVGGYSIQIELDPASTDDLVAIINDQAKGKSSPQYLDDYHGQEDAKTILEAHLWSLNRKDDFPISDELKELIAKRALGNPRICKQILKHFTALQKLLKKSVNLDEANEWMSIIGIDRHGLHKPDVRVIRILMDRHNAPLGAGALASLAGISKQDLELVTEPRLEYNEFLERTPKGRRLTALALKAYQPKTIYDSILETFGVENCHHTRRFQ